MTNTGQRGGADEPQLYQADAPNERLTPLIGFERVELKLGESQQVTLTADPRLLERFDDKSQEGRIDAGDHTMALSRASAAPVQHGNARLVRRTFGDQGGAV